jgi:hypothetical protein
LWGAGDAGAQGGGDAGAGSYYCGDPAADPPPGTISGNGIVATNSCNTTHCNEVYPAYPQDGFDPQFIGRPCTPYAFRSGFESSYCYNPATDPPPAESDQQCGDYWTAALSGTLHHHVPAGMGEAVAILRYNIGVSRAFDLGRWLG